MQQEDKPTLKERMELQENSGIFLIMGLLTLLPFYFSLALGLVVSLTIIWRERDRLLQLHRDFSWLGIFVSYNLIVSLVRRNWFGALIALLIILLFYYFYDYRQKQTAELYLKLLRIFSLGSIPLALLSIYRYLSYALSHGYGVFYVFNYNNIQVRAEGTFFNANYYGLYCVLAIIMAMYLIAAGKDRKHQWLYYVSIGLNLIAIVLTASRMLLPTVVICMVVFLFFVDRRFFIVGLIGAGILLVTILLKPDLLPRGESLAYAFKDRLEIWSVAWQIFKTFPIFGGGELSYLNYYYLYSDHAQIHAHQLILNSLANYGVVGCGLLVGVASQYIKSVWPIFSKRSNNLESALIITCILAVLIHGLVDVSYFWLQTGPIILYIILLRPDNVPALQQLQLS